MQGGRGPPAPFAAGLDRSVAQGSRCEPFCSRSSRRKAVRAVPPMPKHSGASQNPGDRRERPAGRPNRCPGRGDNNRPWLAPRGEEGYHSPQCRRFFSITSADQRRPDQQEPLSAASCFSDALAPIAISGSSWTK